MRTRQHIRSLDGMRAVGALLVAGSHWNNLAPFGWMGVHLFFVLSGYLITSILVAERGLPLGYYLKRFYYRRSLRIFPLYYAFLLVGLAIAVARHAPLDEFPSLFLYYYNWVKATGARSELFGHLWSLAIEEQFYLVWPLVVFAAGRKLGTVCILVAVAAPLYRAASVWLYPQPPAGTAAYYATLGQMDALALGAAVAVFRLDFIRSPRLWLGGLLTVATIAGHLMRWNLYLSDYSQYVWGYTLLDLAFALAVLAAVRGQWLPGIGNGALCQLGRVSYGFYLLHVPVVWWLKQHWRYGDAPGLIAAVAVTWIAATVSFQFLEKRFIDLKERHFPLPSAATP